MPFTYSIVPPPVDFATLGQMAVLGDFDALTPIVTSGQQNTFDSNTFSILELTKVPLKAGTGGNHNRNSSSQEDDVILSAPILLANFSIDNSTTGAYSTQSNGITATCVLEHAPHQVYIGGYFKQSPSVTTHPVNGSSTSASAAKSPKTGINYIGLYDSKLKQFLSMGNGLDGPVQALVCDSSTDQVYVVGKFRAPLQGMLSDGDNSNSSSYQTQGSFGGGVAIWKRDLQQDTNLNSSDDINGVATQAAGSWIPLPFKGLNGVVTSVTKASDGTFYFGGQFDTTADGESFSAPDTQLVNMDKVMVTTGNGEDPLQDRNIICQPSPVTRGNWIMRDNIPGYWRAEFPLLITPTLFRLWNIDTTEGGSGGATANRGTKTFSIMAQPSNQLLNLSYIDPETHLVQYCTTCTLLPWPTLTSVQHGHQDFLVVTPVLLHAVQIDIKSWYGQGGGLGGIEVYQSEIFVRAVDALNSASTCSSPAAVNATNDNDNKDLRASSSFLGADWVTTNMTDGWQTVMAANVSATDGGMRKQAYVDLAPYLQESGMYDVYLYTPACSSKTRSDTASSGDNSTGTPPSNACKDRGFVDVNMYFASPENVMTVTLSQTNNVDKYDKIYSGMIVHSTPDFRPHVVVGPSVNKTGTNGGGNTQSVIVDSIQFVKQATLNNTSSLLFYRPGSGSFAAGDVGKQKKDQVHGLDSSVWGNLPTQLPNAAIVNSLVSYYGLTGPSSSASSLIFIGGSFLGTGYTNLVACDGMAFVPMAPGSPSASGLDGVVYSMALYQSTLYVVGAFQQAYGSGVGGSQLGGLAMYDIQSKEWTSFGNVSQNFLPGVQFQSIQLSTGAEGQPQLILEGKFSWAQGISSSSVSVAVWDINNQKWFREDLQANINGGISEQGEFPFGYVHGQISYLNRVLGSNSNISAPNAVPVVLVAGTIDSLDSYKVRQPENMAWLTSTGALKTVNLSPAISMAPISGNGNTTFDAPAMAEPIIGQVPEMPKASAGIMYFNKDTQQWITIVGGAHADGTIGAGYFNTPAVPSPSQDSMLTYKDLNLAPAAASVIKGEILALGINKDEATGYTSSDSANELLLIGGAFESSDLSSVNGLALYDLAAGQVVSSGIVPTLQGIQGRNPVVQVIKSRPGNARKMLVLAGDFSGVGSDVFCELICLWEPAEARKAIDSKKSIESSFASIYGDSGSSSKKHLGTLKGVVNDIAFEDDKNMFVAGDLIVNGVPCGVASFNFDNYKWTTFGSMINTTSESTHPPSSDTLTGPVTAIAHDSMFHRFFIAGRSSADGSAYFKKWDGTRFICVSSDFMPTSDVHRLEILPASKNAPIRTAATSSSFANDPNDNFNDNDTPGSGNNISNNNSSPSATSTSSASPQAGIASMGVDPNDTTYILEQGYVLLVSGRIVLGTASPSSYGSGEHQESSLAFFDGQSWFPYLQSSRNGSSSASLSSAPTNLALANPLLSARHAIGLDLIERAAPVTNSALTSSSSPSATAMATPPLRVRDQGVFRALAIAHLPRIIARDYLSLPYIILISIAISLGLILLIVLFGFLFVWLKRRFSKEERASRPKLGSSFMEDGHDGYVRKSGSRGRGGTNGRVGPNEPYFTDTLGVSQGTPFVTNTNPSKSEKIGSFFFKPRSGSCKGGPESASAILASLGIADAATELEASSTGLSRRDPSASNGRLVYRPNSTIAQATDALVTQFVRNHQQQIAGTQNLPDGAKEQSAPPSPDRRSKKSSHSIRYQQSPPPQGRGSSSSDLMNPLSQRRFSTLLTTSYDPNNPTTPISREPTSPATSMTTPGGVIDSINAGAGTEALVGVVNATAIRNSGGGAGGVFYYAKFPFRAREIGELGFRAGERILVVDMSDDIWWMGVIQDPNGQQVHGVFPSNYVGPTP
ncbi:hypothetical protein BGX26_008588 [Mortierella sp. AD094]|nr:hypothetical protein BGX26_008588 [Mortierella sp. AD094]